MWFPTEERIVRSHDQWIESTGGEPGVRDLGPIRSAVERARWGPFRHGGDLAERAALLVTILAQEHPFVDGNKRAAFETMVVFIHRNGQELTGDSDELVAFMLGVAQGMPTDAARAWILDHLRNP